MATSKMTYERLMERKDEVWSHHTPFESGWQEIADYTHPMRTGFTTKTSPGQKLTGKVFDSTALNARDRLGSALSGNIISREYDWFSMRFRDEELNDDHGSKTLLQKWDELMLRSFGASNFYSEGDEWIHDFAGFGTGGLYVDERETAKGEYIGCNFRAMHLSEYAVDEGYEGVVDTVFESMTISLRAAIQRWGLKALGDKARRAAGEGKMSTPLEFVHAVFPRDEESIGKGRIVTKTSLPFASFWLETGDKIIVEESGYDEFPFMVPRWRKKPGEKYGRGPGHIALPDVKTLNQMIENILMMQAKGLNPPMNQMENATSGYMGTTPGYLNLVRAKGAFEPTYPPGTFREAITTGAIDIDRLQKAVNKYYYADSLEVPIITNQTAYEFAKRLEMLYRLLGPTLGRFEVEGMTPLISRKFGIMLRRGAFGDPKDFPEILRARGADIDVEYQGPLAKSQRLVEVEGIERLLGLANAMLPLYPEVVDNLDPDQTFRDVGDIVGVPEKNMRDADEVAEIRAKRAQEQAEAAQMEQAAMIAKAAGQAAPALALVGGGRAADGA